MRSGVLSRKYFGGGDWINPLLGSKAYYWEQIGICELNGFVVGLQSAKPRSQKMAVNGIALKQDKL